MPKSKKSSTKKSKGLKKLGSISEKDIDYSDIPETDESFWASAEIHLPRKKEMITLRLDPDIIEYFKAAGNGYQTKMNAILKSYVEAHPRH